MGIILDKHSCDGSPEVSNTREKYKCDIIIRANNLDKLRLQS